MSKVNLNPERQSMRDVDIAIRRLKKIVEADGLLKELQKRREYTKPSIEKKVKKAAAKARWRREQSKNKLPPKQF